MKRILLGLLALLVLNAHASVEAMNVPEPVQPETMEMPAFTPGKVCGFGELSLDAASCASSKTPQTFEHHGQNQGIGVYRARIPAGPAATLTCKVHDFAWVYVGNQFIGTLDRRLNQTSIELPGREEQTHLHIVVDTFGHVKFSEFKEKARKGIIGKVMLGKAEVQNWRLSLMPLDNGAPRKFCRIAALNGALYRAEINLENPIDTFLDMKDWQKGYVWVNGHLLGRYWNIGPHDRLYCPGEFMKNGINTIEILDLFMTTDCPPSISGKRERNMEVYKGNQEPE